MIDYSRKRKSLVSTVVPNLDKKLNLVLLGDSFTAGDGSNSETIIPKLFDNDWREFADRHSLAYFRNHNKENYEDDKWTKNFTIIQQQYIEESKKESLVPINKKLRWSSIVEQHTGYNVINYGRGGNSFNGIAYSLAMWLNKNPRPAGPVCVLANFTYTDRHSFVSRFDHNRELMQIGDIYNSDTPQNLIQTHNANDGDMDEYFVKYDDMRGYEFDLFYTIWLCEQLCEKHKCSFAWSGPSDPPLHRIAPTGNYCNFPIDLLKNISTIIPEFKDIIEYHRWCNKDTEVNPLSPCGHYNQLGQQTMGREFSRKLLENEDWLFQK